MVYQNTPSSSISIINVLLFCGLISLMVNNRLSINTLKSDMNKYIEKDLTNLKKVLEVTMHNDEKLQKKTDFILNVLEEDEQIQFKPYDFEISQISDKVDVPKVSNSWIDNIVTNNKFKELIRNMK